MSTLHGARVALLESRMSAELAELVRRMGGHPVSAPAVREVPRTADADAFLDAVGRSRPDVVILLTGVGATAILQAAERRGQLDGLLAAWKQATLVCRGPKPTAVARRHGLEPAIIPERPYTTAEMLRAMSHIDLKGRRVALVHYGERSAELARELSAGGAELLEVCPYEWALPEDVEPLRRLVVDEDAIDAIAFTSQIQVRNLFEVAREEGRVGELARRLNDDVIVAAVGPVCADALKHAGVMPDVQPGDPKMGPLLVALADYIELTQESLTD